MRIVPANNKHLFCSVILQDGSHAQDPHFLLFECPVAFHVLRTLCLLQCIALSHSINCYHRRAKGCRQGPLGSGRSSKSWKCR